MTRVYPSPASRGNRAAAALIALLAAPAGAQYEDGGRTHAATFAVADDPGFGDPLAGLALLRRAHRTHRAGPQHFCVVGYRYRSGERAAYVHWREGRRLVLWEGGPARPGIGQSRRDLDLDTDVMPDGRFNGSTYMLFAHEVRDILADCARAGRRYVLR